NLKKIGYNFLNTLTRQTESYHTSEVKNVQDRFEKWSFQDHFLTTKDPQDSLQEDTYKDLGNFANQIYEIIHNPDKSITLARKGVIKLENPIITHITKKYQLKDSTLLIDYTIDFSDDIQPNFMLFSPEINIIGASHPHETFGVIDNSSFNLETTFTCSKCQTVEIRDLNEGASFLINFIKPVDCTIFPLFSTFKSEIGVEEIYQGTSIFPKIKVSGKKLQFVFEILLKSI
ncbi:MAG: alpha-amylase/4-alpha-glucanotransferase domain-containing protein, partial [Candidatus Hodarchaeota archaeon]